MCDRVIPPNTYTHTHAHTYYTLNIHNHLIQSCSRTRIFTAILKVIYFNAYTCSFVGHNIHTHTRRHAHIHTCLPHSNLRTVAYCNQSIHAHINTHTRTHAHTLMFALGIPYLFYQMKTVVAEQRQSGTYVSYGLIYRYSQRHVQRLVVLHT